jgi:hypothetical protein
MSAKGKRCIVLVFGERGVRYGVGRDGQGSYLPRPLMEFLYSFGIDSGGLCRVGCEAYFAYSRTNLRKIERMVTGAERLRETQFPSLGIGLAHGRVTGQCNWLGRLKRGFTPEMETIEKAYAGVNGLQTYQETLKELHDDNTGPVA